MAVLFRTCKLFDETITGHKALVPKLKQFIENKSRSPLESFGSSDKPFASAGIFGVTLPGIKHAHLDHDVSIVYRMHGGNPKIIDLYAVCSHDQLGTGQPGNRKKQKSMSHKLSNQEFV